MMTSLVLLVPIVVSVTAASLQQILDDRLISQSKVTITVSPEMELGSIRMDSKKSSRKHPTEISDDTKETKTSQFLIPVGNSEDRLSTSPRTFTISTENGLSIFKKVARKPISTTPLQRNVSKSKNDSRKLQTDIKKLQSANESQSDKNKSENDINNSRNNTKNSQNVRKSQNDNNKMESNLNDVNVIYPSQTTTSSERSIPKIKSTILEKESPESEGKSKVGKRSRKHKAFFFNYPYVPQTHHHYPHYDTNFEECNFGAEERTPVGKKKYQDSNIYYIKLPPTPYMFVPGLGYVSQPPRYSPPPPPPPLNPPITHVRPFRPARPPTIYQPHVNPFIKVPIDFISNGKPTSVYQWHDGKPAPRPENQISNLDKGPYVFNGRPTSIYLLRPDGSQTAPQPIRYNDYQTNGYF